MKEDGVPEGKKNEKIGVFLTEKMQKQLGETIEKDKKESERESKEQKKHITSEDLQTARYVGSLWQGVEITNPR